MLYSSQVIRPLAAKPNKPCYKLLTSFGLLEANLASALKESLDKGKFTLKAVTLLAYKAFQGRNPSGLSRVRSCFFFFPVFNRSSGARGDANLCSFFLGCAIFCLLVCWGDVLHHPGRHCMAWADTRKKKKKRKQGRFDLQSGNTLMRALTILLTWGFLAVHAN